MLFRSKKKKLIYLLENCHTGDFLTGTHTDVAKKSAENMKSDNYYDPTETMPEPPPPKCIDTHDTDENPRSLSCPCDSCQNLVELFLAESPAKIAILGTIYSGIGTGMVLEWTRMESGGMLFFFFFACMIKYQ